MSHVTYECVTWHVNATLSKPNSPHVELISRLTQSWESQDTCEGVTERVNATRRFQFVVVCVELISGSNHSCISQVTHHTNTHTHTHTHTYERITRHVNVTRQKPVRCVCYDSLMCLDSLMNMLTSRSTQYYIGFDLFSWSLCGACRDDLHINLLMSESCQIWMHHEICECDT